MTEEFLLEMILADPDDEASRLMLADWYTRHGSVRGDFIRLQCEAARLDEEDPQRIELESRARLLLAPHQQEWVGPLASHVPRWEFRRGFVEAIHIPADAFLTHAEELFRLAPLRHIAFFNFNPCWRDLVASEHLARLRSLAFSPNFSWRVHDFFDTQLEDDSIYRLARDARLDSLRAIDLSWNRIGDTGCAAMAASQWQAALESLDLSHNHIGRAGAAILSAEKKFSNVQRLSLGHNTIGNEGFTQLLAAPSLRVVRVENNNIDALPPGLSNVAWTALFLDGNPLRPETVPNLAKALASPNLRQLSLGACALGNAGAITLARAPHALSKLALPLNDIGDEGALALANAGWPRSLSLDLRDNRIGPDAAKALHATFDSVDLSGSPTT